MSTAFDPDWVLRPGEVISDYLSEMGGTVDALAGSSGLPLATLLGIIEGDEPITVSVASSLFTGTGLSPEFWLNLEERYRTGLAAGKPVL